MIPLLLLRFLLLNLNPHEPTPDSMPEPEPEEQAGGKKRRRRKKRAGDYSEADFAKMYGSPSSSGPKKRGSKEGEQAIAPYKGGKMPTEEDFKKCMEPLLRNLRVL